MKKSHRNIKYIRIMDSKDKIYYKLNTIPSTLNMDSDNSQNSYDFKFYDTKSNSYFSNDLIYDVFDAEFKANFPEIKNNLNKIQCNKYSITRFSFEIISGKKSLDHNIINDIKRQESLTKYKIQVGIVKLNEYKNNIRRFNKKHSNIY